MTKTVKVALISIYRDGGTKKYISGSNKEYYEDHRIGSSTTGKIFSAYPEKKEARILDVKLEIVHRDLL